MQENKELFAKMPVPRALARLAIPKEDVDEAIFKQGRSQKRKQLLELLRDGIPHPVSELKMLVKDPLEPLKQLQQAGLVEIMQEEVLRRPGGSAELPPAPDPALTPSQQEVLEVMLPELRQGGGRFLLHGVTGSGKTEVFIRLVRHVLAMVKSAIILVPEIALTPQMVSWFRARFGDTAAVLHSRLSAGERFDEWRRIRHGRAKVVIGARSAVFAPCEDLGIIVVDEEHETTYKSDTSPKYHARDIARFRCSYNNALMLLASATPSFESYYKAKQGVYSLISMKKPMYCLCQMNPPKDGLG